MPDIDKLSTHRVGSSSPLFLLDFIFWSFLTVKSVAVIPVRRSVFDDKLKCKYRTFPGSVSDDVVKVMREGESGKNQMEMQKLIGEPDWGSGVIEWENGEEIADIQIDIKNQHFEGTENIPNIPNPLSTWA